MVAWGAVVSTKVIRAAGGPWEISPDNLLWLNGRHEVCTKIWAALNKYDRELQQLHWRIQRVHTKQVRHKEYFYEWTDAGWKYCGREDPTPRLQKMEGPIKRRRAEREKAIKACILGVRGLHLIVKRHIRRYIDLQPSEIVSIPSLVIRKAAGRIRLGPDNTCYSGEPD